MKINSSHTALITGASSGIGKEFARQVHGLKARVILVARRKDLLEELAAELNNKRPDFAEILAADLTKEEDLKKVSDYIKANKIDLLVNNAGRGSFNYFEKLNVEDEINQVKLNIIATQKLAHAIIPQLKERKEGAIISVSSIAAFQPLPFMATYAATKSFNYMHSLALREELKPFNVKVLVVCPGPTATEFGGVARVPGTLTGIARDSAEMVVASALKALSKNKAVVITGFRSKIMSLVSKFLPKTLSTARVGRGLRAILLKSTP